MDTPQGIGVGGKLIENSNQKEGAKVDVLTDKKVTTRKSHQCHGCGHSYPPKTEMRYTTTVDGGDIVSAYWCKTCDEIIDKTYDYHDLQDGIQFGEIKERDVPFWEGVNLKHQKQEDNNELVRK